MRWILASALVGCGGFHGAPPPPDAPADSSHGDAPAGAVTLTAHQAGGPIVGATVYFQNADSSLVSAQATDANGTAFGVTTQAGFVTLVVPRADALGVDQLMTFSGVQPGEDLHVELAPPDRSTAATFDLTIPTDPSAAAYAVHTSCGDVAMPAGAAATVTQTVTLVGCNGVADMLVVELDPDSAPIGSLYQPGLTITDGKATSLTGSYAGFADTVFSYSDVPASISAINLDQSLLAPHGRMLDTTASSPAAATTTIHLGQPIVAGATALVVSDAFPISIAFGEQLIYDWGPATTSYALDYGATALVPYASAPTYDLAQHAVTWTEFGTAGAMPDLVRTELDLYRDDIPIGRTWHWQLIGARGATPQLGFPVLPADPRFDFNPAIGDSVGIGDLTSAKLPGGYDAIRTHGFDPIASQVTGPTGRIVIELPYAPAL